MNSEGAVLDQLYAYWSAGLNPLTNSHALPAAIFNNTVAHRSNLAMLEYGFAFSFPAGTTFPSATYVKGGCEGAPVMYRTTEDKAFYYNGSSFVEFPYAVSQERMLAVEEVNSLNYREYYEAEQSQVDEVVRKANAALNESFTSYAIQEALANYTALDSK